MWYSNRTMIVKEDLEPIEWHGMPGMEPRIGDRVVSDAIIHFGKSKDQYLSQQNSHWLSFVFRSQSRPGWQLQLIWDMGMALLSRERVKKGSQSDPLLNLWCSLRRQNYDPGMIWASIEIWTEEEMNEVVQDLIDKYARRVHPYVIRSPLGEHAQDAVDMEAQMFDEF